MFRTYKKIPALLAIFILFLCVAAATEYKITDYRYEIDGFTKVWALANRVEGKDEVFSSVEELEKALADKRQTLWNTSLFYHVNCTWEETGRSGDTVFVTAIIAVEDSGSSIILPYPKYDSNTGFSLGLRYKNNNFMGTLGNAAASLDWEQDGKSFSQSNFDFEVPVENILLKNGSIINFELGGVFDLAKPEYNNVYLSAGVSKLKIKDIVLGGSLDLYYRYSDQKFDYFKGSVSASGINLGDVKLALSYASQLYFVNEFGHSIKNSYMDFDADFSNIKLGEVTVTDSVTFEIKPEYGDVLWSFIPYYVDNITSLSIPSDVLKSLSISLEGYMNFPSNNQFLEVGFSFVPGANITAKTDVYLDFVDGKGLSAVSVYENLSTSFKISKSLTLSPSMRLTNLNYSSYSLSDRVWLYRAGVTLSGGQINRVSSGEDYYAFRDNFRTGIKLDAEARILWNNIFSSSVSDPDLIARAAVTAFFMPTKTFNPSFRFYVAGAVDAIKWFNQYSGSYYAVANLYTFSDYTMTPSTLNSIVRGVRLDNEEIDGGGYESRFMGYFSANLTTAFLYFEEFGHLYVSPFIDAVVFTTEFGDDTELISGVGLEGYLIMDSHASYPIRASLGFNLESIIDKFKGGTDPLEYELFIGLNFLY